MAIDLVGWSTTVLVYGARPELVQCLRAWLAAVCLVDVPEPVLVNMARRLDGGDVVLAVAVDVVLLPVVSDVYAVPDAEASRWLRDVPEGHGAVA